MNTIRLAHRGYSSEYKENTKEAIENSIGKFDGVEIDIRLTKDKEFILMHDPDLDRTSSLKGKVEDFNLKEIIDSDKSIYTLKQFLLEYSSTFKYVNIDMKNCIKVCDIAEERLINLLNQYVLTNSTYIISSYYPDSLNKLNDLSDKYKLALLISKEEDLDNISKANRLDYLSVIDTLKDIDKLDKEKLMVWSMEDKVSYKEAKIIIENI